MTAAENIAEDFGWVIDAFPLFAAIIASMTAIYLATVAYSRQKEEDRKQLRLEQKREVFLEYLKASASFFESCLRSVNAGNKEKAYDAYFACQAPVFELLLYIDKDAASDLRAHLDALITYRNAKYPRTAVEKDLSRDQRDELRSEVVRRRHKLLTYFRQEILGESSAIAEKAVENFFTSGVELD